MWRLFVGRKDGQRNAEETGEFRRQPRHAERAEAMNRTSAALGALDQDPLY
jgi:hypothetical protein